VQLLAGGMTELARPSRHQHLHAEVVTLSTKGAAEC